MMIKKIIATLSATAIAVSALAVSAFAAEHKATAYGVAVDGGDRVEMDSFEFVPYGSGYNYGGWIRFDGKGAVADNDYEDVDFSDANVLIFDITTTEKTNLEELRLEFKGNDNAGGARWGATNEKEGTLTTTDGKTLVEAVPAGQAGTYTITLDCAKSNIIPSAGFHVHTSGTDTGKFTIANVRYDTVDLGGAAAPAEGGDKGTPDTGVEGVAVVAGIAVLAAGVIVVAKKRK